MEVNMHYIEVECFDSGDKIRILHGKYEGKVATVKYEGGMDNVWAILDDGTEITMFKDCVELVEDDESNEATDCEYYNDGICSKDKVKCYLKEINDSGLYFDCKKKIF
jgi:hypothetical protein